MHYRSPKFPYTQPNDDWMQVIEWFPSGVVIVDDSNTIMWMNAMAYTLFKVSTETQIDGLKWDSLVFSLGPEGSAPCDLLMDDSIDETSDLFDPFKAFITGDSNTRVEVHIKKVQFGGHTFACCYILPDTKEETVMKGSLDAVVQADLDKNIIGWNSAAENTFGYAEKDITGKSLSTIFPRRDSKSDSDVYQHLMNHKGAVVNRIVGATGQRRDGKEIPLEMAISALNYASGKKYFSFFIRDLSQLKYIEQMKSVEEASQAKSNFVSSISHELRSPLNTIFGFGQLLTEMPLSSEQLEYVHGIINASEALIQLVSDMADLSKIEAHKIDLEAVPFSVASLVNDVINSGLVMARSKHIEIASFVSYDCPSKVMGDARRLKQVLINLVNNGIKFTENGCVVVNVEVKHEPEFCEFMFQVSDTGIGIAQEDVGKLFKRFSQLNSQRYGGSGLGLAISAELVRLMGGEIGVLSGGRGKGSTLWFSCKMPPSPHLPPHELPTIKERRASNPFNAVVAYNEEGVGSKLTKFVSQSYNIDEVPFKGSMEELIDFLEEKTPATGKQTVVLVDEDLDDFREMFKLAKEKAGPNHHFVIIRGTLDRQLQAEGACPCTGDLTLMKPINQAKLRATLDPFNLFVEMITHGVAHISTERRGSTKESGPKSKILVAEDNTLNFLITQKMLSSAGYECTQASNGYEVLQQLSRGNYGLVLMDCMMPRLDGYATTKMIRESKMPEANPGSPVLEGDHSAALRPPPPVRRGSGCTGIGQRRASIGLCTIPRGIPVVAMTANAMRGDREKCLSVGMNDYISKPFQKQQLIDIVQKWIPQQ